ncbi:MAG TPA: Ig-like domain-containing protein [Polyangiaceae bacterium]|nr:Ig-like domain-containing protein [Polyangiaceae bacterium]
MRGARGLLLASALAAASFFPTRSAQACSQPAPPVELIGYPADGATQVPTDVRPIYDTIRANTLQASALASATFEIRSSNGTVIPATAALSPYAWHFELTPQQPLAANTSYALVATLPARDGGTVKDSVTFTSGSAPAAPPRAPHDLFLQNYHYSGPVNSCGPIQRATCVAVPAGQFVVMAPPPPFAGTTYLLREAELTSVFTASSTNLPPSGCLTFRTRAPNGSLSEPVLRCAEASPHFELSGSAQIGCTPEGLTQDGRPVAPGRACSISHSSTSSGAAWFAAALAFIGAFRAKRRSKR